MHSTPPQPEGGLPAHELQPHEPSVQGDGPDEGWSTDVHVRRWQGGDDQAFDVLYRRFAPLLAKRVERNATWPLLKKRIELDDAVQAIWARVIPAAKRSFEPRGPGSFLAFLATVAGGTLVDLARHQSAIKRGDRVEPQSLDAATDGPSGNYPDIASIETPTSRARESELIGRAKDVLSEREYDVWEMRALQGYSFDEIGLAADCSPSAGRGVFLRARRKLVGSLADMD